MILTRTIKYIPEHIRIGDLKPNDSFYASSEDTICGVIEASEWIKLQNPNKMVYRLVEVSNIIEFVKE